MAALGQGDPRWIVTEREDGKNCNDWHWSEKNVTQHAHELFRSKLEKVPLPETGCYDGGLYAKCKSVDGEVQLMNRKGRAICALVDLAIEFDLCSANDVVKGTLRCYDVENSSALPECDVKLSAGRSLCVEPHGDVLRFVRKMSPQFFHTIIMSVVSDLQGEPKALPRAPAWAAEGPVVVEDSKGTPAKSPAPTKGGESTSDAPAEVQSSVVGPMPPP